MNRRIVDIILSDFTINKLKLEEELQRILNDSNIEVEVKIKKVKKILKKMALIEKMFELWISYCQELINNNNEKELKEDGQVQ